jgi:hypothetical protein
VAKSVEIFVPTNGTMAVSKKSFKERTEWTLPNVTKSSSTQRIGATF